jgi:hypothetical protein
MEISFDFAKSERKVTDRGLPFTLLAQMEMVRCSDQRGCP